MIKKHSMAWYKQQTEKDYKLRRKVFKGTPKRKGESATKWLGRVNKEYRPKRKRLFK